MEVKGLKVGHRSITYGHYVAAYTLFKLLSLFCQGDKDEMAFLDDDLIPTREVRQKYKWYK